MADQTGRGEPFFYYYARALLVLQNTPVIRDAIVRRRVHPAAIVSLVVSLSAIPLILGLAESPAWAAFVENVLGAPGGPAN